MPALAVKPKLASWPKEKLRAPRVIVASFLAAELHRESTAANDELAIDRGYITVDPIGVIPGVGNSPNVSNRITDIMQSVPLNVRLQRGLNHPYAYVRNNPLRWRDPSGLLEEFFDESEFAPGTCFGDGCTVYGVPVHTNQSFGQCMAVCMTTGPLGKFCSLMGFAAGAISDGVGGVASNGICRVFMTPICKDKCEQQQCPPNDIMSN
jgi:hypothetical protein